MEKKSILDVELDGKRVFCRVDFNVPVYNGTISDETRIIEALPTIRYIVDNGGMVILASHRGRPQGKVDESLRLKIVGDRLAELIGIPVLSLKDSTGIDVKKAVEEMKKGDIILLENVRFHPGEEANDPALAKEFAELSDLYVDDAFGTAHRAHASTAGIAEFLPAVAGLLMLKEMRVLSEHLVNPQHPYTAIIGGAKAKDKIEVISNLLDRADNILIGGGLANNFIKAMGHEVGKSILEEDKIELAQMLIFQAAQMGVKLMMPVDVVVAREISEDAESWVVPIDSIPEDVYALDIGPETVIQFTVAIACAKLIIWNGPMGLFEIDQFSKGTVQIAESVATSCAVTIVGGGDSLAALKKAGVVENITHISTGGGASLYVAQGKILPAVAALDNKEVVIS